jgi:carboxypeptidase C (cathepsin A)
MFFIICDADEMYSGLMPISWKDNTEGALFFWLSMQRNVENNEPPKKLIVWLNGGPGCSSMIGMMHENGPFSIQANTAFDATKPNNGQQKEQPYILKRNPYSWNEVANVLYLEQPIRTGFSLAADGAEPTRSEVQVAADFRGFMISFLKVFPQFSGTFIKAVG